MSGFAAIVVDALVVAAVAGSALLLPALALARTGKRWSGHLRHELLAGALLVNVGALAVLVARAPAPLGCVLTDCTPPLVEDAAAVAAREQLAFTAALKFSETAEMEGPLVPEMGPSRRVLTDALASVWLAGVCAALFGIGRRRFATARILREAQPVTEPTLLGRVREAATRAGIRNRLRIATHARVSLPAVAGAILPTLLLPSGLTAATDEEHEIVLLHELAHVRRRDGLTALLGELVAALLWFNPIVHRAVRRVIDLQEVAADSHVVRGGVRPSRYAHYLLALFRRATESSEPAVVTPLPHGVHSILGDCQLESRVRRILDASSDHRLPTWWQSSLLRLALVAAATAIVLVPGWMQPVLFAQGSPPTPVSGAPLDRGLLTAEALDRIIRPVMINAMADRYVAGAGIAVVYEGRLLYAQGFGRREVFRELPVDIDRTIWRIGSITKVITAIAVLQLVDQGQVDLDADVNLYLRDLKVASTYPEPVRVRHLLTHTAGFDQIGLGRHAPDAESVRPLGEFLASNLVRIRPPGVSTTYDTYAITLAGHLVEQVSGLSFETYVRRRILDPLEMHRAGIAVPPALRGDVAVGYSFAGQWEAAPWEYMNTAPASSVNATVPEMARLAAMLLEGGQYKGRRILSEHAARAMMTPQFTNHPDQPGYGYALFEDRSRGVRAFSHGGSMEGFGALLYLVPEHRIGIYVATNQESASVANPVIRALVDSLFPGHGPPTAIRPRLAQPVPTARFEGRYANSMYHHGDPTKGWRIAPFQLRADSAGHLIFNGAPAFAVGPLSFQRNDGVLLSFREDERGQITDFVVNQTVYERLRP